MIILLKKISLVMSKQKFLLIYQLFDLCLNIVFELYHGHYRSMLSKALLIFTQSGKN